jgi:hypothetical protein
VSENMPDVSAAVAQLQRGRSGSGSRSRRVPSRDRAAGRLAGPVGRAWINGREVGGSDPRYAHLAASYD